jgi:hypothetical protein
MKKIKELSPIWVMLHFITIVGVFGAVLGGMRIATLSHPAVMKFSGILPQGDIYSYHSIFGGLAFVGLVGLMFFKRPPKEKNLFLLYIFGVVSILVASFSGIALYNFGDIYALKDIHFYSSVAVLAYTILHGATYGLMRFLETLPKALQVDRGSERDLRILARVVALFLIFWIVVGRSGSDTLIVKELEKGERVIVDGNATEKAWQKAPERRVYAYGGGGFFGGSTIIKVKALKDSNNFYIYITWKDPTKSLAHLPLVKEKDGWRVKENGFYNYDEKDYYEDKLALLLSNDATMGAGKSVHLGAKPLPNHPANWHKRGYHYTTDGTIRDLWHWKAVRSDPMQIADDDFFGTPASVLSGKRRYKAGYIADGKDSGGVSMNWTWYTPHGVVPKRLPPAEIKNPDPNSAVPWYDWVEYNKSKDHFRVGDMLPSVLLKANTLEGDQADVKAKGHWENGWWHLEMSRALDTGSKNDLPIKSGVYLWISAFDHVQVRHTRHARPLKIEFEGSK